MKEHFYDTLPDGSMFSFWQPQEKFTKTYYVMQQHPDASDDNPGTKERPFKTINKAAQVLMPGERVLIGEGVYKEFVRPLRGGTGPDAMISYEAIPGEKVVISGLETWNTTFVPSVGWRKTGKFGQLKWDTYDEHAKVWQGKLDFNSFEDCNPFSMLNVPPHPFGDNAFLFHKMPKAMDYRPFMMRRGLLFCDGKPLRQVEVYAELWHSPGTYWVEDGGLSIHFRLFDDGSPEDHTLQYTARAQLFSPIEPYFGYIRVKGLTFEYVGNGFPGAQKGALSTYCGHHWVIENNTVRWANSVGIDTGHETTMRYSDKPAGYHIIRNNVITDCGLNGLCGLPATAGGYESTLIENNRFERIGWHNAEILWESGAIKIHGARNCLIRHNVILDTIHGPAIWTDYNNKNTRICGNVVIDVKHTLLGSIFVEASHEVNKVDNNVVINVGADYTMMHSGMIEQGGHPDAEGGGHAIYEHDSDYLIVENNFISGAQGAAIFMNNDANPGRIVNGRGSLGRKINIIGNIIDRCHEAILLPNEHNFSDFNLFGETYNPACTCRIQRTKERFNLRAWREFMGWDVNGKEVKVTSKVNKEELTLYVRIESEDKVVEQTIDLTQTFTIKEWVEQILEQKIDFARDNSGFAWHV
jgi:hypothetical protein